MRIVAGELGGRRIRVPPGVRPTSERVREAWFSILGEEIEGADVIELFAGSGALAFEALSRGARKADLVERSGRSIGVLKANVAALGLEARVTIHRADALRFIDNLRPRQYDVAFADPPFGQGLAVQLAEAFARSPFAGLIGIEHEASIATAADETRRYGDTAISFLRSHE